MPLCEISCALQRDRSMLSNSTRPRLRGARPMMARNVVVLPTPLRPSSATDSPGFTSKLTPCRMCSLPKWTCTSASLSMYRLLDEVLVLRTAEVSLTHSFVGGDFLRAAVRQDRPLSHHGNVVRDLEHDFHVVLDDDDVDALGEFADFADGAVGLGRAHAASRLVQQQQPRLRDHCHADFQQRHVTMRQGAGR